jgi:threonine aldolase
MAIRRSKTTFMSSLALSAIAMHAVATALALAVSNKHNPIISLQSQHPDRSPAQVLEDISQDCTRYGVDAFDIYGDFGRSTDESFIRRMEAEMANEFGKEDAVFMPSGVMAQSIALLIHASKSGASDSRPKVFACHHSSHLLLHEGDAYRELLHLEPIVVSTEADSEAGRNGFHVPAMSFGNVETALQPHLLESKVTTLILELPHRELGGKLTPWNDIILMSEHCKQHDIRFHCDGARIFEASAGYNKPLKGLAAPFDTVYVSMYKGLGAISGAMLLGSEDFCEEARVWLRRFGGNLYTLLPYALSGWSGYQRYWCLTSGDTLSFREKKDKLVHLVASLSANEAIQKVVRFDPAVPDTNMVHGYLHDSAETCRKAIDATVERCGIRILHRVKDLSEGESAYAAGFRTKFEWAIGEGNEGFEAETYLQGWAGFARELLALQSGNAAE